MRFSDWGCGCDNAPARHAFAPRPPGSGSKWSASGDLTGYLRDAPCTPDGLKENPTAKQLADFCPGVGAHCDRAATHYGFSTRRRRLEPLSPSYTGGGFCNPQN